MKDWLRIVLLLGIIEALTCCSHAQMGHSEMWKACAAHCAAEGGDDPTVVEDEHARGCVCAFKKREAM